MTVKFRNATQLEAEGASNKDIKAEHAATYGRMEYLMRTAESAARDLTADEKREYDALEKVLDSIANMERMQYVDRTGVVAPESKTSGKYQAEHPLAEGQSFSGYVRAMGHNEPPQVREVLEDAGRPLSLAKALHGAFSGDWRDAEPERILMSLSGATAGAGGVLLPTVLLGNIIDLARNKTRVMQAGATVVPMDNKTVDVPRWLTDPSMAWRAENAAIASSDPTMDKITLTAKSLAAVTTVSRELVEDTDVDNQLEAAFAAALSLAVDSAAMYGTGASNQPTGVKTNASVTKTSLGANGATPSFDTLVDAVGRLRDQNEEPTAQIMADRVQRSLAKIKDTTNQYVAPPAYLDGIDRYSTNQVPINLTQGSSTDASDIFTADWAQLLIGIRTNLQITLLTERYMPDAGQYGFVAWWRGDIAVARPKAFDVVIGARP